MNNEQPPPPPPKTYRQMIYDWWEGLDWTKSNMDLSCEFDVSTITVGKWRDIITGRSCQKHPAKKLNIDWDSLDWSKNNTTLAKELGIPYRDVRRARTVLRKPFPSKDSYHRVIDRDKLDAVDWEMTKDVDIAKQFNVSRERIRQLRNELQKPACLVKGLGLNATACVKWMLKHKTELDGKIRRDIADMFNKEHPDVFTRSEVYKSIHMSNIKISLDRPKYGRYRKRDWSGVNFSLPNIVLQMIYDFPSHIIAVSRDKYFKGRPGWHIGGYSKLFNDEGFIAELEAEKAKAIAAGFKVDSARIDAWLKWKRDYKHPDTKDKEQ